jgi:DNA-binding NtrC family response regulator
MINPAQPLLSRSDVMLSSTEPKPPEASESEQIPEPTELGKKTRVLIVEDDGEIRAALHDALDDLGYDVLEDPDAERALVTLGRSDFDAVLVDVRMPGMGGIALCRHLASDGPHLPVVVMTAFGDVDTAVEALRAGACDFITKPISIQEVARVIERSIAEHPEGLAVARLKQPADNGAAPSPLEADHAPAQANPIGIDGSPEAASLEEVERRHIEVVLRAVGWNKARAARELGIDRSTLYRKLIRLGLTRPR